MSDTTLPFLPFARPDIGDAEIAAVTEALRSGWVTTGPKARAFEQAFTDYLGGNGLQSIAVNSATAGLHLALEALGIGPGDEVIAPTLTFTATVEVVRYLGADPVLVDVDPVTLNIDPEAIRAAITPRTKAIMPVHYGGLACDMDAMRDICKRHNLLLIEDCAQSMCENLSPDCHSRSPWKSNPDPCERLRWSPRVSSPALPHSSMRH